MKIPTIALFLLSSSVAHAAPIELGGCTIEAPSGWKAQSAQGRVVMGHDRDPGMIVAWFDPSATEAVMRSEGAKGLDDPNFTLRPTGAVKKYKARRGKGLVVDLRGEAADGAALQARVIGVLSPKGGGVVLLAITAPKHFPKLSRRLDAVASSVRWPKASAAGGAAQLRGALCTFSGTSNLSTTQRVTFDGRGGVTYAKEMVGGGSIQDNVGNEAANWGVASGNQYSPTASGTYAVRGDVITVRIDGETLTCRVHMRQNSGQITEVKCGDQLWGASLCE